MSDGASTSTSIDYAAIAARLAGRKRRLARHSRNIVKPDIPPGFDVPRTPEDERHLAPKPE